MFLLCSLLRSPFGWESVQFMKVASVVELKGKGQCRLRREGTWLFSHSGFKKLEVVQVVGKRASSIQAGTEGSMVKSQPESALAGRLSRAPLAIGCPWGRALQTSAEKTVQLLGQAAKQLPLQSHQDSASFSS